MRILFIFLSAIFFAAACIPTPAPLPLPNASTTGVDAGFGTYTCATWCSHAAELKCPAAAPTDGGASCVDVCENMRTGPVSFNLQCRSLASSCSAADNCENTLSTRATVDSGIPDSTEQVQPATCEGWCKHALDLKCQAARPTPRGATCVEVCGNVQSGPVKWNLKCRAAAKTCSAADACPP